MREALTVGRIGISQFFFSIELQKLEARKRIKDELLNVCCCTRCACTAAAADCVRLLSQYCVVTEAPKTTFGKVRKTYTGKLYGKQDDLAVAMQLAMIGCQKFFQDPKYRNFRVDDCASPPHTRHAPCARSFLTSVSARRPRAARLEGNVRRCFR